MHIITRSRPANNQHHQETPYDTVKLSTSVSAEYIRPLISSRGTGLIHHLKGQMVHAKPPQSNHHEF